MKIALTVLVALFAAAPAANAAQPKAKTASASVKKSGSVKAMAVRDSKDTMGKGASAGGGSTSTTAEKVGAAAPSKLGFHWLTWTEGAIKDALQEGTADTTMDHSLRANYKLNETTSARLAVEFAHTLGAGHGDHAKSFTTYDPYVQIAKSELVALPSEIKVSGAARFYPAVTPSTAATRWGVARGFLTIKKSFGALTASLDNDSRWLMQRDLSLATDGKFSATELARTKNYLTASVDFGGGISAYQSVGTNYRFYNEDGDVRKNTKEMFFAETGLELGVSDAFSMSLGVTSEARDLRAQTSNFDLYRSDETGAFVNTNVFF